MQLGLFCADESGLKQIDVTATIHLTSDELEARDLAFSLSVGPGEGTVPGIPLLAHVARYRVCAPVQSARSTV